MREFKVQFVTPSGRVKQMRIWAPDRSSARSMIRARKLEPVSLHETGRRAEGPRTFSTTLPVQDVIAILDQLEMQIGAHVTLVDALQNLVSDLPDGKARFVVGKMLEQLAADGRVAQAFAQFPRIFPDHVVQMVDVGHRTGKLEQALGKIVAHLDAADEIRGIVKKAMTYPCLAFLVISAVFVFLVGVVIPEFGKVFTELGISLPWITRFYMGLGSFVSHHIILVVGSIIGAPIVLLWLYRQPKAKAVMDHVWIRVPIVKDIVAFIVIARLAGNLGALYEAEIVIQDALIICSRITGNVVYDEAVKAAVIKLSTGSGVGDALATTQRFPTMMTLSIKTGEASGSLGTALEKVNRYYTRRSREKIAVALQFIEPIMTIGLGVFVGSVAASMFYPLMMMAVNIKH